MRFLFSLCIFIFLVSLKVLGQEQAFSFKNETFSKRIKKDSYTLSNIETNDLAIVIVERNKLIAQLCDKDFKPLAFLESDDLKSKYNQVLGYSIDGSNYHVLYSNDTKKKFAIVNLDFSTKNVTLSEIDIDYGEEIFLDAINYNNNLYFLTANDDLKLTIRAYNNEYGFDVVKNFSLDEIKDKSLILDTKWRMGIFFLPGSSVSGVTKIDQRIPNAIEQTSSPSKLYQNYNKLYLTIENSENHTAVYDIDLDTYDILYKTYEYPKGKLGDFKKFNSYIYEDKFYQIASSKEEMAFVVNRLNGQLIKEFHVVKESAIPFKNSPIIQDGMTAIPFVNKRELEETSKYLRKITSGDVGITVLRNKSVYYITLGGFEMIQSAAPMMGAPMYTSAGTFVSYNPAFLSYNSYATTKSTYFNSIFDLEFNHQKGKFEENVFDKIKSFQSTQQYNTADDVFFHNETLYFGYYDQKESEYHLVKF